MLETPVEFLGIGVSEGGKHMTLVARSPEGTAVSWTLPSHSANALMVSLMRAPNDAAQKQGQNPPKPVFSVDWWTVGAATDGIAVLSFR